MQAFLTKYQNAEHIPEFTCSNGFIEDFKERNRFRSRRAHYKRRPTTDPAIAAAGIDEIQQLIATAPDLDRVVNCDETCWRVYPNALKTWAPCGSDNVQVTIGGNDKDSFTALCSITAARRKLPMVMIAKGKTTRAEHSQLGDVEPHVAMHSESGWITVEGFQEYLTLLKQEFPGDDPIFLILDCYSVHRTREVQDRALELRIIIKMIPGGMTDSLQPLDRAVFGVMKATARRMYRMYRMHTADADRPRLRTLEAVQFLTHAWEQVSPHVLDDAWHLDDFDDPE
jgi:hypothetical protein